MAPAAAAAMHFLSARLASFSSRKRGPLKWPHASSSNNTDKDDVLHLDGPATDCGTLALAGFFHAPVTGQPDRVQCFSCGLHLAKLDAMRLASAHDGGAKDDEGEGVDALSAHLARAPDCAWARLKDAERRGKDALSADDSLEHPANERWLAFRLKTFEGVWPHEDPSAHQVAAAGMYFAPENQDEEHDTCRCAFCHRSLGGWEAGDDPMADHKRKEGKACAFFKAQPKAKRGKQAQAQAQNQEVASVATTPAPSVAGDDEDASAAAAADQSMISTATTTSTTRATRAKRGTKKAADSGAKTTRAAKGKRATRGTKKQEEEDVVEDTAESDAIVADETIMEEEEEQERERGPTDQEMRDATDAEVAKKAEEAQKEEQAEEQQPKRAGKKKAAKAKRKEVVEDDAATPKQAATPQPAPQPAAAAERAPLTPRDGNAAATTPLPNPFGTPGSTWAPPTEEERALPFGEFMRRRAQQEVDKLKQDAARRREEIVKRADDRRIWINDMTERARLREQGA